MRPRLHLKIATGTSQICRETARVAAIACDMRQTNTTPAYGHGTQRQITTQDGIQKAPGTHSHAPDATKVAASRDHGLTRLQASRSHNRIPPPQCKSNLTAACDPPSGRRTARRRSRPAPDRTRSRTGSRQRSSAPWSRRSPYRAGRWPLRYRLRRTPAAWC